MTQSTFVNSSQSIHHPSRHDLIHEHLILRRLMWPLTAVFILLTILVASLLWHQENRFRQENLTRSINEISRHFQDLQTEHLSIMQALLEQITSDSTIREALRKRDRERLLQLTQDTFEIMRREQHITHFYFQDTSRNNILRVQFPDKIGGRINRYTLLEAERTGQSVGGLELGYFGILILRQVKPVFSDDTLLGYVELGIEMQDLLESLHPMDHSVEIAITLHKQQLQQDKWLIGRGLTRQDADWDRFPQDVLSYSSLNPLPDELLQGHLADYSETSHGKSDLPGVRSLGRFWRVGFLPLIDAAGRDIGDLAIMLDVTLETAAFQRTLLLSGAGVSIILALLMWFLFNLLKKTDQQLVDQQNEIAKIEVQHQAVIDVAKDGIILIDDKGIIQLSNPAIESIFGYQHDELLGKNIKLLMPEPYHSEHDGYLRDYRQTGKASIIGAGREVLGKRKDGSVFPIELAVTETCIDGQRQYVGVLRDITQRKQAEQELIHARDAAEQASEAKTTFLSSMSHELRTPLNAILGFGQLLDMSQDLDADRRDWIREIMKAGHHLLRLVNDVLDLARIESEEVSMDIRPVVLHSLANACISLVAPLAGKHSIQLSMDVPEEVVVRADPDRLKQVLLNLLSNAIKYNRPDGRVHLEATELNVQHIRISVTDTGRGIPEDKFDALFQPFNRLGAEGNTIEGTGIGLTVTLRIVELMGGMLGVESEVNVGSRFWLDLPRAWRNSPNSSDQPQME